MNDSAYDIAHLERELAEIAMPGARTERPAAITTIKPPQQDASSRESAQEALARELMLAAETHEEMIRQFLSIHRSDARGNGLSLV